MVRKHKLLKTLADLKLDKQVRDPISVRSKLQSNTSSKVLSPPMICHGSESCGCLCHYAKDDPPPCYTCCQDQDQPVDSNLAKKVLLGKSDSISRGKSHHLKDYVLRDEFGCEIPRYRKKINRRSLHLSKVMNEENSSNFILNPKDSLRIHRECFSSQVDDLNIENLSIAANKSTKNRIMANSIFNSDSHLNTILTRENIENRIPLRHHTPELNHRTPNLQQQSGPQLKRSAPRRTPRDEFGLELRDSSREGCIYIENRLPLCDPPQESNHRTPNLQQHPTVMNHRMPTQCGQQLKRSAPRRTLRDEFGLELRDSSREGCTVS